MASAERPSTIYALPDAELTRPWEASNAVVDRVYIIGAGASVAYGLPTLKWLTWDLYQSLNRKNRKIFLAAVYEAFSETLRKDKQPPDFEELLNRLDPRALLYLQDSGLGDTHALRPQASKVALSGLRAFILDRCRLVAEQTGPYDSLVRSLSKRSAVVSFNWDVLLECAFIRAGRPFAYLPTEYSEGSTVLLKPHGSINWFALLGRELLRITGDSNLGVFGDDINYYILYLKDPLGPIKFGSSSSFVKAVLSRVPAIIPPTASKLLSVGGKPHDGFVEAGHTRAMKAIWNTFKTMLDQASELVVIGYSLPGTDAASIEVLKHFADGAAPTRAKRVLLVEPNPAVAERYKTVLHVEAKTVCSDFRNFDPDAI